MSEKNSLVEEAIIQMKNLEDVIAENAKGILASTMKEEIGELVKESLKEANEEDLDVTDVEDIEDTDDDSEESDDMSDVADVEFDDEEFEDEPEEDEDGVTDLTKAPMSKVIKAFMEMGEDDGIIITQDDDDTIELQDTNTDKNYLIKMGESVNKKKNKLNEMEVTGNGEEFDSQEEALDAIRMDEELYEDSDEADIDALLASLDDDNEDFSMRGNFFKDEDKENEWESEDEDEEEFSFDDEEEFSDDDDEEEDEEEFDESDETIYEITMDSDEKESMEEEDYDTTVAEGLGFKAKGKGMGKPEFSYEETTPKSKKPKMGGKSKGAKVGKGVKLGDAKTAMKYKGEMGEASRTLGSGKKFGRKGLDKPRTAPRHLAVESVNQEVSLLRAKNEEYRKALNVFRDKLNEVAVFNSNLAYATRLFTEHSTTKQEKINILRRFDGVENLKESKTLYKVIKDELSSQSQNQIVKESIETKINRTPSNGSSVNLIESKTYENPQFLRMKDLMKKII
jgi:hypothetical protein